MNKTNLWYGLGFMALGLLLIFGGIHSDISFVRSMGFGFAGCGGGYLWRFWRWSRPGRDYERHLRQERINSRDEMLVMLRQRAGLYTYVITMCLLLVLAVGLALCCGLNLWQPIALYILWLITALSVFLLTCYYAVFYWLRDRYY